MIQLVQTNKQNRPTRRINECTEFVSTPLSGPESGSFKDIRPNPAPDKFLCEFAGRQFSCSEFS